MVAPRAAPPAGAFLSGQAVFHGRELLAELPLVSDLPSSCPGLALGGAVWTGPATPLGLDPGPCPERRGVSREAAAAAGSVMSFFRTTPLTPPPGRVSLGGKSVAGREGGSVSGEGRFGR